MKSSAKRRLEIRRQFAGKGSAAAARVVGAGLRAARKLGVEVWRKASRRAARRVGVRRGEVDWARAAPRVVVIGGFATVVVLAVVVATGGLAAELLSGRDSGMAWDEGGRFVSYAVGTVEDVAQVTAAPGGGRAVALLRPGTEVQIAVEVADGFGFWRESEYWIRWQGAGLDHYGLVASSAVAVTAGLVPEFDGALPVGDADGGIAADSVSSEGVGIAWLPETIHPWFDLLVQAGQRHHVDPEFLAIVMLVESGGNPRAGSHAGARGLMQVMPPTGRSIAEQLGVAGYSAELLYDPEVSVEFGAFYLAQQLRTFGRLDDPDWQVSVELAAAAYNGGPGNVQRGAWPRETQSYVRWVGGMWRERRGDDSPTYRAWLQAGGSRLIESAQRQLAMR